MKFSELKRGTHFRQAPEGKPFGTTVFVKLPINKTEYAKSEKDTCDGCHSTEVYNAHNGVGKVHFCPDNEVWPV
jgi:hypothetical protein